MPGFLSTSTDMIVCTAEGKHFDIEKLRANAFPNNTISGDMRLGWVGLGDLHDIDHFTLATVSDRFVGFSLRIDTQNPSAAMPAQEQAEESQNENTSKKKCHEKCRGESKECGDAITRHDEDMRPNVIDCLWDLDRDRFFICQGNFKAIHPVLTMMRNTFGVEPKPLQPNVDMSNIFATIQKEGYFDIPMYTLSSPTYSDFVNIPQDKKMIGEGDTNHSTQKSLALSSAPQKKIQIEAYPDCSGALMWVSCLIRLFFTMDTNLVITDFKLSELEKNASKEAIFLANADKCIDLANIFDGLTL